MLQKLPLGLAYSALKIAVDEDPDGRYLRSLEHLPRDIEDARTHHERDRDRRPPAAALATDRYG